MKLNYSILAAIITLTACTQKDPNAFSIKGTIDGLEGSQIILSYGSRSEQKADTAVIANGKFAFSGSLERPEAATLYVGSLNDQQNLKYCQLYIEPVDMTISIKTDEFNKAVLAGSKANDECMEMNGISAKYMEILNPLYSEKRAIEARKSDGYIDSVMTIDAKIEDLQKNIQTEILDFMKSHPASPAAADYIVYVMGKLSYEELKSLYDGFTPEMQARMTEAKDELETLERVLPGKPAPELKDIDLITGEEISLCSLKGKVVLLDFWASWCVPCRASMPHIISLYNKYQDRGFDVFCVADNDGNPEQAVSAAQKDGTTAFHHVIRGMVVNYDDNGKFAGYDRTNDKSDLYAIHYLPTKYLIDADGNIIGKVTDEELDEKLKEIFGF